MVGLPYGLELSLPCLVSWGSIHGMDIRSFFRAYAKSPLGLGSILVALGAGAASLIMGLSVGLSAVFAIASFTVLLLAALFLGVGQRAAVAETDREAKAKAADRLAVAEAARKRLASLRLAQVEVASARDLLVLEAGSFIEHCGRARTYDPEGVAAIVDSLALVDGWLKEADESSVENRFDLPDANPFPEAATRTARALRDKAALIASRRAAATGEISGADRLAIEVELK